MQKDISGQRFGKLIALQETEPFKYLCSCDCGNEVVVIKASLTRKKRPTHSCGCIHKEGLTKRMTTHGMRYTRVWRIWSQMIQRCTNENVSSFEDYGGRGIYLQDSWFDFEDFFSDMENPPTETHTLDRINPDGNYELKNCRWATPIQQANNKRNTIWLDYNGERMSLVEVAHLLNIKPNTLRQRYYRKKELF